MAQRAAAGPVSGKPMLDSSLNPNNLWNFAAKQYAENKQAGTMKVAGRETKKVFVFVGDKRAGKSTLIGKLLNKTFDERETIALDFKSGTQSRDDLEVKINTYEIGGGRSLTNLLSAPLALGNLDQVASICIVLDLSKPQTCLESLNYWYGAVKEYTKEQLKALQSQRLETFKKIHSRLVNYWEQVPVVSKIQNEVSKMQKPYVPITVIGTKFDLFTQSFEPVQRKVFCQALRYTCHKNGCNLVFSSNASKGKLFTTLMNWHVFRLLKVVSDQAPMAEGQDEEAEDKEDKTNYLAIPQPMTDPQNALMIFAGTDSYRKIGEPQGAAMRQGVDMDQLWLEEIKRTGL